MKRPFYIVILGLILAVFVLIFWKMDVGARYDIKNQKPQNGNFAFSFPNCDTSTSTINKLNTYVNDRYGFSYKSSEQPISFGGEDSHFSVRSVLDPDFQSYYAEYKNNITLKEYVQSSTQLPLEYIEEIVLNGRIAYRYQDTLGYKVITEDHKGVIYVIKYDKSDCISYQKFLTLVVDSDLILKKDKPTNWKVVKNSYYNFQFSYPSNIFLDIKEYNDDGKNNYYALVDLFGKRGSIRIEVYRYTIGDFHNKLEKVNVGNKTGYYSFFSEGGRSVTNFYIPLSVSTSTMLKISFGSDNYEDLYQISRDKVLQTEILSTFNFTNN